MRWKKKPNQLQSKLYIHINPFPGCITGLNLSRLLASLRGVETMYSRFKKRSHEKKQCVVCERAFRKDDEVEAFMQKVMLQVTFSKPNLESHT